MIGCCILEHAGRQLFQDQLQPLDTMLICIMMHRHTGLIASMLGVLLCGAAYAPVDPSFPPDRQSYIFEHSQCPILLADEDSYQQALSLGVTMPPCTILISSSGSILKSPRSFVVNERLLALERNKCHLKQNGGLMYVLYTSGSTGKPKGVMVPQYGVTNFVTWFANDVGVRRDYRVLGITTVCFDISVVEIYLPLVAGATLVLAEAETQKDPYRLLDLIRDQRINFIQGVPTSYEMLLAAGWTGNRDIDFLTGGEAFRHSLLPLVKESRSFRHGYGPTETTVISSCFTIRPSFVKTLPTTSAPIIPIGKPIANTEFFMVEPSAADKGQFIKVEEEGELLIGGIGVARGYIHAPELTRGKFIANPFGKGIVYRTGDIVRRLSDGNYIFVRRIDDQVKVDGYRIELSEIEFAYAQHPLVEQAVVIVRSGRLSAYIKCQGGRISLAPSEMADLKAFISRSLTHYMVPTFTTIMTEFPQTANGKIDRNALPDPKPDQIVCNEAGEEDGDETTALVGNTMLAHVCSIMHSVKGVTPRPTSTFGALGVDSLGAAMFVRVLSDSLGGLRINQVKMYRSGVTVKTFADELYERMVTEKPEVLRKLGLVSSASFDVERQREGDIKISKAKGAGNVDYVDDNFDDDDESKGGRGEGYESSFAAMIGSNTRLITGIRGAYTLIVLWGHFHPETVVLTPTGESVVLLFVILSGFTTALQLRESGGGALSRLSNSNKIPFYADFDVKTFILNRAIGIFPILWLALVLYLPLWLLEIFPPLEKPPQWYLDTYAYIDEGKVVPLLPPTPHKYAIRCGLLYVIGMNSYHHDVCNFTGASFPSFTCCPTYRITL